MNQSNRVSRPKYPSTVSAASTRDSSFSTFSETADNERFSGIVTTANAISLQRASAQTKAMGDLTSPKESSVEKSIGVTTRSRRSREVSARNRIRESTSIPNKSEKGIENSNGESRATSSRAIPSSSSSKVINSENAYPLLPINLANISTEQSSDDSTLLTASTSPVNRFLSPATSTFGLEQLANESPTRSNSMDLNPYSDAWGQNSTVAAERAALEDSSDHSIDTSLFNQRPRNGSFTSNTSSMASRSVLSSLTTAREVGMMSASNTPQKVASIRSTSMGKGKQEMLQQLLASLALIDSRPYKSLHSIEEVESYKKELARVEKRMIDVKHKLKVEMRVRDAADKLRKAGLRRMQTGGMPAAARSVSGSETTETKHTRMTSIASAASQIDVAQAEAGVAMATKRTDAICKDLIESKEEAMVLQRKLLEHQTRTLALRVSTLEEERAERLQSIEEEERSKVGANLAIEEVDKIRDKLKRVEKSLGHEKRDREEEVGRWKKKHEDDSTQWRKRQEEAEQKWKLEKEDVKRRTESAIKQMQSEHAEMLSMESSKRREVEKELAKQMVVVSQLKGRQNELEQLELEMTAERNIMTARQQLFVAFEKRLKRTESRLREQDDRCAQMLGKVDGREEMDNILEQIKAGYGAVKKEKTAGQDIDGLIDSITTHLGDLEDELHRAGKWQENPSSRDRGDLEMQLEIAERELQVWRSEAEGARRSLVAVQRQSTSSLRSKNILTEAEARMTLMERKNTALEAELAESRLRMGMRDQTYSPPVKVAGIQGYTNDSREVELLHNAIQALLCMLPTLDPMSMDLRKLQMDLSEGNHHSVTTVTTNNHDDAEENCHEVMDRSRALITISTRLVDRALASESKQEAFESEIVVMEQQCEDLRSALEDLRRGNASHKAREMTLQTTVNELRKSLTAKSMTELSAVHLDKMTPILGSSENFSKLPQSNNNSSNVSLAATRRGRGIPNPLPMARSNSNLSFTSSTRINANKLAQSTSMPQALKLGMNTTEPKVIAPLRSMTLGMGAEQLRLRVRQLETELIQEKSKVVNHQSTSSPPIHAIELQQDLVRELDEHRRELDYVKGVESKQRIDLLDELTTLTGELSEARAQLRAEQRKKAKAEVDTKLPPSL